MTYSLEYKEKDDYKSRSKVADAILEEGTEKITHTGRLALSFSTLSLFQKKKFFLPVSLSLAAQSIFAGKNTPKYDRADLQVRFYF